MRKLILLTVASFVLTACSDGILVVGGADPGDSGTSEVQGSSEGGADAPTSDSTPPASDSGFPDTKAVDSGGVPVDTGLSSLDSGCIRKTCADLGATCGTVSDGCGGALDCGGCDDHNPCTLKNCESNTCAFPPFRDGARVFNPATTTYGTCHGGEFCDGCWDGTTCHSNSVATCGVEGGACTSCDDGNACTTDSCDTSGVCHHTMATKGTICSGGACNSIGSCVACGGAGQPCCGSSCGASLTCDVSLTCSPGLCGGPGQPCCTSGPACGSWSFCATSTGSSVCEACGGKGQPACPVSASCPGGFCCQTGLYSYGGTCNCGGLSEACCPGNTCSGPGLICYPSPAPGDCHF